MFASESTVGWGLRTLWAYGTRCRSIIYLASCQFSVFWHVATFWNHNNKP